MTSKMTIAMKPSPDGGTMVYDYGRQKEARVTLADGRVILCLKEAWPEYLPVKKLAIRCQRTPDACKVAVRSIRIALGDDFILRDRYRGYVLNPLEVPDGGD